MFTSSVVKFWGRSRGRARVEQAPIAARGTGDESSDQVPELVDVRELATKLLDLGERETSVAAQGRQVRQATLLRPSGNSLRGDVEHACNLRRP